MAVAEAALPDLEGLDASAVIREAARRFGGRLALVSSFGAESAVLLHLAAEVDRSLPVVFLDTGQLFPETLAFRDEIVALLGLADVRTVHPQAPALAAEDPDGFLWSSDPDRCCHLRKVLPLEQALAPFDAWISGRKRYQSGTRAALPVAEREAGRVKINPLAAWGPAEIEAYRLAHDLPRHPLVQHGFLSIGCMPCTTAVRPGEDPRAGRWRGKGKTECGIHVAGATMGATR